MVENCFEVTVFCVCSAVAGVLLKQYCSEQSLLLSLCASVGIIIGAMNFFMPLIDEVQDIFTCAGLESGYISIIFKGTAICILTRITCGICRDSGETALAASAELWGRGALLFISLPLLRTLTDLFADLL